MGRRKILSLVLGIRNSLTDRVIPMENLILGIESSTFYINTSDVLNVFIIINDKFFRRSYEVFNPRNSMYISHINGKLNTSVLVQRDTLINANTLLYLGRNKYTDKQMNKIIELKEKQKAKFNF
jgi:hypothetical protein